MDAFKENLAKTTKKLAKSNTQRLSLKKELAASQKKVAALEAARVEEAMERRLISAQK